MSRAARRTPKEIAGQVVAELLGIPPTVPLARGVRRAVFVALAVAATVASAAVMFWLAYAVVSGAVSR